MAKGTAKTMLVSKRITLVCIMMKLVAFGHCATEIRCGSFTCEVPAQCVVQKKLLPLNGKKLPATSFNSKKVSGSFSSQVYLTKFSLSEKMGALERQLSAANSWKLKEIKKFTGKRDGLEMILKTFVIVGKNVNLSLTIARSVREVAVLTIVYDGKSESAGRSAFEIFDSLKNKQTPKSTQKS